MEVEHQELLTLTPQIEANNTERLEDLMTLAKIRKMSLRAMMMELGLIMNNQILGSSNLYPIRELRENNYR